VKIVLKFGSITLLETSGPLQAFNGIALLLRASKGLEKLRKSCQDTRNSMLSSPEWMLETLPPPAISQHHLLPLSLKLLEELYQRILSHHIIKLST
jgi:hypothetical protein